MLIMERRKYRLRSLSHKKDEELWTRQESDQLDGLVASIKIQP
jgi:hypothetical protein